MKQKILILFHISFLFLKVTAQQCKDSSSQHIYSINNIDISSGRFFSTHAITDKSNNVYFNWLLNSNSKRTGFNTFIKINNHKQVIHAKEQYNYEYNFNQISLLNQNNELIGAGTSFIRDNATDDRRPFSITISDTSGKMKKGFQLFNNEYTASLSSQSIITDPDNNIVVAPASLFYTPTPQKASFQLTPHYPLIKLNSAGEIQWQKKYDITNLPNFRNEATYIRKNIQYTGEKLFLCGGFSYTQSPDPYNERLYAFFITEINIKSGNIIRQKSLNFVDPQGKQIPHLIKQMYYESSSKKLIIIARELSYESNMLLMHLDEQFNVIKVVKLIADPNIIITHDRFAQIEVMSNQNILAICNPQEQDTSIYYTLLNKNLDIFKQRKIKLNGYYPIGVDFGLDSFFDQEGTLNFMVQSNSYLDVKLLLLSTNDPTEKNSTCYITDSNFYTPQTIGYKELTITFLIKNLPSFTVTQLGMPNTTNLNIFNQELCKQISTCYTPKIIGSTRFCLEKDSLATFTVSVNNDCKRTLQWMFDTTSFRHKQSINDSAIQLQLLKPYKGFIIASINGCNLRDSIAVEITNPSKACNLGNDTFFCPNSNQVLSAGTGYKSYQWQDGAVSSSYTVTKPGTYWLRVTDSCDNVSTDTVHILPQPYIWQPPSVVSICKEDSVAVWLNPFFTKPEITPPQTWALQKDSIIFFPLQTTVYHLEAVSTPGCKLYNTITITVNNCPVSIHFPNAFSPNNDGLNDLFKPIIEGVITDFDFKIFNRWGQLVFTTTRFTEGWNGVFKGSLQPAGNYTWSCRYQFKNKKPVFKKGSLLLIN